MSAGLHLFLGALAACLAGFVQGTAGFGFALVLTPILLLLGGARTAVFSSVALGGPLSAAVIWQTHRHLRRVRVVPMLVAAAVGTPLGLLVLTQISSSAARAVASLVALCGAILLLLRRPSRRERTGRRGLLWIAGFTGGLVNGATGMGGPPAALIVAAEGLAVQEARGLLSAFNLVSYPLSVTALLISGSVGGGAVHDALLWLPAAALGMLLGSVLARRVPQGAYPVIASTAAASAAVCAIISILY